MNRPQELMVITMEECGELTQICSKTLREADTEGGVTQKQREKVLEEAGDVHAMIQLLVSHGFFTYYDLELRSKTKHEKLRKWSKLFDENQSKDFMLDL